jgi:hypothetical protein
MPSGCLDDQDSRLASGAGANLDYDVVLQGSCEVYEALYREGVESVVDERGDLGLVYAQNLGCLNLGQFSVRHDLIDRDAETQLGVCSIGTWPEPSEHMF